MNLILAFLLRDLAIEKTYKFHFVVKVLNIFFQLVLFYFLSKLVPDIKYFSFVLIGLIFSRHFQFWLDVFSNNIRQEQHWGTAELIFLSPHSPFKVLLGTISAKLIILIFEIVIFIFLGSLMFNAEVFFNPGGVLPLVVLNTVMFLGLGLISASFIMYYKRGDPVNWIVLLASDILCGVYFPVNLLPSEIQGLSYMLPTTLSLQIFRDALLNNAAPPVSKLLVLTAWSVPLFLAGIFCFRKAFNKAREEGNLGSY
ncbi:MAG: ABC transporter permease [Elusimicrobia bacterium]|nr:ABC transporter permease [Candidatus Liberimonas magnetica]